MASRIGRAFKIAGDQVIKLNPNAYSKKFMPPRKQTWQEKLVLSRNKPDPLIKTKKGRKRPTDETSSPNH